jgi:hypothetical protein
VLCQLSYAPRRLEVGIVLSARAGSASAGVALCDMAAPSQRRALGALFAVLTALFVVIAVAAIGARVWVVGVASAALALWVGGLAVRSLASR